MKDAKFELENGSRGGTFSPKKRENRGSLVRVGGTFSPKKRENRAACMNQFKVVDIGPKGIT